MPQFDRDEIISQVSQAVQDAFYATVGAGVLTAQHLDAFRRQLTEQLSSRLGTQYGVGKDQITQLAKAVEEQLRSVDDRVKVIESQIDTLLDAAQDRLPEQAGDIVARARKATTDARKAATETSEKLAGFVRQAAA